MLLNWVLIIGATLATVGFAVLLSRRSSSTGSGAAASDKDFLLAGKSLSAFTAAGTLCATYWSGHAFVGSVGTGYAYGYTQIMAGASYIPPLVFACIFMAKFLKKKADKMGSLSIAEYAAQIHGSKAVHGLCALANACLMFVLLITQFSALGTLLSPILGIDGSWIVVIIGGICIVYTMYGGLKTVAYSDIIMAVGMTIGAAICLIYVFKNTSLGELTSALNAVDPELVNPSSGAPYGSMKFGALLIMPYALFGLISMPYTATRFLSVKNDIKWWKFGAWCCVFAMFWEVLPFVGNYIRAFGPVPGKPDDAMAVFLSTYMNPFFSAFVAVFIMMAIRSTVDSVLQSISSSISYDLRKIFVGEMSVEKSMKINRAVVCIVGVVGICLNFFNHPSFLVFLGTLGSGTLSAIMFGPIFISTFWQGNKYGAIASMIGGGLVCGYGLASGAMMWTVAPLMGDLVAAVLYVVVSMATFKICPRAEFKSAIVGD